MTSQEWRANWQKRGRRRQPFSFHQGVGDALSGNSEECVETLSVKVDTNDCDEVFRTQRVL